MMMMMMMMMIILILSVAQIVKRNSCYTVYPRNMVCFRYIIVNTLHKEITRIVIVI